MSFRPRAFPELRDMSSADGRRIVAALKKRMPFWPLLALAFLFACLMSFLQPLVLERLVIYVSTRWAELIALAICIMPIAVLYEALLCRFWIRPEIRRIRGPKPNKALHQTGER